MIARRAPHEVAAEVEALKRVRPRVPPETFFGDDNRAAIDAEIETLEEWLDEDDIDGRFESEHEKQHARDALAWASGDSDDAPSVGWLELAEPAADTERGRFVSSDGAVRAKCQHQTPCSDCPWTRKSLNGWLGQLSVDEWLHAARTESHVECHTLLGAQCAGIAIYRRNTAKLVQPPLLRLERDTGKVFASADEFRAHHTARPSRRKRQV